MLLAELKWPEVDALSRDVPVILPIAAHEQHGHHLPLHTDSLLLGEVVRRLESSMGDRLLFAPLQWLGNSHHHLGFPGTLSSEPRAYLDLLLSEAECLLQHGFRRLVFLNGHGGNQVPGAQAVFELRQQHRRQKDLLLLSTTYWEHGSLKEERLGFSQSRMGHACEWETSMMLVVRPDLVGAYREQESVSQQEPTAPAARGWTMGDRSERGHIGDPAAATPEKGERLLETFTQGLGPFFERLGLAAGDPPSP